MPVWPYRHQLSLQQRLRRSVYEVLRDQMDVFLIRQGLVESYRNFRKAGEPYPFVARRELKPRARVVETEYALQNHFLVIFCEGTIPAPCKKYIRFFDSNRLTKESIGEMVQVKLHKRFSKNLRYFEHQEFERLLRSLLPVDYALLIQQDQSIKKRSRYALGHFHVRVDWPVDDASEDMARHLRYIARELYENGEQYAQRLQHKLFEMHGFHPGIGGRRTAAVVAAQYLKRMEFISTVYVCSSEGRSLTRLSERGASKFVLIRLPTEEIYQLAGQCRMSEDQFIENFLIDLCDDYGVGILQVAYLHTSQSKPPEDGKLRRLRPDYQWLTVADQLLIPLAGLHEICPLPYSTIYSTEP